MADILSFRVTGSFASFRDPSVTSNQLVYYIPSKTAIVGLTGALVGVRRDNLLGESYQEGYLDLFSKICVGLRLENNPRKIVYYTNHRSLKGKKTKPVKKEVLEKPCYRFFIKGDKTVLQKISDAIGANRYVFSPCLGHSYCPAQISDLQHHNAKPLDRITNAVTDCVVLDELDSNFNEAFEIDLTEPDDATLIVERHLHHFLQDNRLQSRVLKHWIPVNVTCRLKKLQNNTLSRFYEIDNKACCFY